MLDVRKPYAFLEEMEAADDRDDDFDCNDFPYKSGMSVPLPDVRPVEEHPGYRNAARSHRSTDLLCA